MKQHTVSILAMVLLAACSNGEGGTTAQGRFVGTWELVSIEQRQDGGEWGSYDGRLAGSVGVIMYDALGNMAVHIMVRDRPALGEGGVVDATAEQLAPLLQGYGGYFGTYEVHESEDYVVHHRRGHLLPGQVGTDAQRFYEFSGDELTLTVAPERALRLTWRRKPAT